MKPAYMLIAGAGLLATAGAAQAQRIPPGHLPPPGECRVWLPDRPPGHQPPPTSCRAAERQADRYGGQVIYGGRERRDNRWRDRDDWNDEDDRWEDDRWEDDRDRRRAFSRWALRNFDYNRDGRLSRTEYRRAVEAYRRR